jgi:hypothetical protein
MKSDNELRQLWLEAGGNFRGPHVETGFMSEEKLLPFLRDLLMHSPVEASNKQEPVGFIDSDGEPHLSVNGIKGGNLYRDPQAPVNAIPEWQPIDSHPKSTTDKKCFLVWCPENLCQYMVYWDFHKEYLCEWNSGGYGINKIFSHWMPLPSEPQPDNNRSQDGE